MAAEFIDHYLIEVDSIYDNKSKSGLITINDAYINPESNDRYIHKRLWGTVLSVPLHVTATPVDAKDPGFPPPHKYVSADFLQSKVDRGYTNVTTREYYPSTYEGYEKITYQDIYKLMDVQVGDKVYFDEKVTEPENLIGRVRNLNIKEGQFKYHFRCRLTEIFCAVKDVKSKVDGRYRPKIFMQGGWVLADLDMETWEDITLPSGIVTKVMPEARAYRAWIQHIRKRDDIHIGDHVIFDHHSDLSVKIEGHDYYLFKEENILCCIKNETPSTRLGVKG